MAINTLHHTNQEHSIPWFWPMAAAIELGKEGLSLYKKNLIYLNEVHEINHPSQPVWATLNKIKLDLDTMLLRDFSQSHSNHLVPTLIVAPYAGQSAIIADFSKGKSLVEVLISNGLNNIFVTDWKPAIFSMKDFGINKYLDDINKAVNNLGGVVTLVGLCQGGWLGLMYASLHPNNIRGIVLAGSPIDTDAGDGAIKRMAHSLPMSFYENLVRIGGGLISGNVMLAGWKSMKPQEQYFSKYLQLYEHIEDRNYIDRTKKFEAWYENVYDLPGAYYLETIKQIFKENQLVKGQFIAQGKLISLKHISCPVYMLAGTKDEITPVAQIFNTEKYLGTSHNNVYKNLTDSGHLGLFMGSKSLAEVWPKIADWILDLANK